MEGFLKSDLVTCRNCQNLLCFQKNLKHFSDGCYLTEALFNYDMMDEFSNEVFALLKCQLCSDLVALKLLKEKVIYIFRSKVQTISRRLKIGLISIRKSLLEQFESILGHLAKQESLEIQTKKIHLKKSEIGSLKIKEEFNCVFLLHFSEGRLLLTNKNGLYQGLLEQLASKGNFCFIITNLYAEDAFEISDLKTPRTEKSIESQGDITKICNLELIQKLAQDSQQPSLTVLAECLHLVTVNKELTEFQKAFLQSLLFKSLHRALINPRIYEAFGGEEKINKVSMPKALQILKQIQETNPFKKSYPEAAQSFSQFFSEKIEKLIHDESCNIF